MEQGLVVSQIPLLKAPVLQLGVASLTFFKCRHYVALCNKNGGCVTERAAGLWSGLTPTTRSGRVRRDPSGYPERLREVAPGRAQVSGPVDRVSAFHYCLKVTHGQGLGKDNRPC